MRSFVLLASLFIGVQATAADGPKPASGPIDFSRQIRPILSDNCFACHGPDETQRKAKLRLDTKEGAYGKLKRGGHAVVPGKPDESALVERILSEAPSERMPPPKSTKKLTVEQIELLKRWVAEGANYSEHWAFVAPKRPAVPAVKDKAWVRNPLDAFILARLEKEGLRPAGEADRVTLVRRLFLDLTGLPATPGDVDAFLRDKNPDAYEKLVERLLASPHYGERMALDWLDAARFADTHGYHIDSGRDMTRWREYVIDAFSEDLPYDRFTVEQLAGDLLPGATLKQKIASGFNRNHMINFEGGAIPAEYHNAYIVDRVVTTSTVWLGLTMICAQCHDHKYDPVSQREFYQLYAFFNNVPENGLDGAKGNAAPMITVPSKAQQEAIAKLEGQIKALQAKLLTPAKGGDEAQVEWEKTALKKSAGWTVIAPRTLTAAGKAKFRALEDKSYLLEGPNPPTDVYTFDFALPLDDVTGIRVEALPHDSLKDNGPGRSVNGNIVLTDVKVSLLTGEGEKAQTIDKAGADFSQADFPASNAIDSDANSGWAIHPNVGKTNTLFLRLARPLPGKAEVRLQVAFQSRFAQHQIGRIRIAATEAGDPLGKESLPADVVEILNTPREKRAYAQQLRLRDYYRTEVAADTKGTRAEIARLQAEKAKLEKSPSTAMVMEERPGIRPTHLLIRGEYDKKGEKVTAATPAFLPPLPKDAPANRLALAKWLVDREHPLTSRVTVNRYWQLFFGNGLVKTSEDFGSQAEPPSHPELLDWLAVEFIEPTILRGDKKAAAWSVKDLVRLIVTSSTYRQSSKVTKDSFARDPENRLLARGPRFRLQAEFIRDQALAVSGLLNTEIGGKSVSPYQPTGLWEELNMRGDSKNWSAQFFEQSHGKDLYRRSMYTFWKRTSPPPQMLTFDAPDRESCTVRRSRTNTPLQALVLMNDPTYVEASRHFAERMLREAKTTEERLALGFRLATARIPNGKEIAILQRVLEKQLARYTKDEEAARKLLSVGESVRDERIAVGEHAAWTVVASVLLNLDEVVTKN